MQLGLGVIGAWWLYADAERIFGSNADAVLEMFQPGQDPRKFLDGFRNAYLSGKMGSSVALENSTAATYLTEAQSAFAFELGERVGRMLDPEGHRAGFGAEETYERNRTVKNQLVNKENADTILDEDMRISVEKLQRMTLREQARALDRLLYKYTDKESKWKGETIVSPESEMRETRGRKLWDCKVQLREDAGIKTLIHELLHARSASHWNELAYLRWKRSEEAAVEFYSREICEKNGIKYDGAYSEMVNKLLIIKNILEPTETKYDFAKEFYEQDMLQRYSWLRKKADELISREVLSGRTKDILNEMIEYFSRRI